MHLKTLVYFQISHRRYQVLRVNVAFFASAADICSGAYSRRKVIIQLCYKTAIKYTPLGEEQKSNFYTSVKRLKCMPVLKLQ